MTIFLICMLVGLFLNLLIISIYVAGLKHKQKQIDAMILGIQKVLVHVDNIRTEFVLDRIDKQKVINKIDKTTLRYYLASEQSNLNVREDIKKRKNELVKTHG